MGFSLRLATVFFAALLLLPARLLWAEAAVDQAQLLQLLTAKERLTSAISLYSLYQGDKSYQQQFEQALILVDDQVAALNLEAVNPSWQKLKAFIDDNRQAIASGVDVIFPRYYEQHLTPFMEALMPLLAENGSNTELQLRHTLLTLEKLRAAYLFYNMNLFGGFSVVDTGIEKNNEQFKRQLAALKSNYSSTPSSNRPSTPSSSSSPSGSAAQAQLTRLERKWAFLEKTMLAYNERSAVFIINRTSDSISASLELLIDPELQTAGE